MINIKDLSLNEIEDTYWTAERLRKEVLEFVQLYGFTTNDLITQNMERTIEQIYGQKTLKKTMDEPNETTQT